MKDLKINISGEELSLKEALDRSDAAWKRSCINNISTVPCIKKSLLYLLEIIESENPKESKTTPIIKDSDFGFFEEENNFPNFEEFESEIKKVTVTLVKDGVEKNVTFIGKHRPDMETKNWHYFEKDNGNMIHFKKKHMVFVDEEDLNIIQKKESDMIIIIIPYRQEKEWFKVFYPSEATLSGDIVMSIKKNLLLQLFPIRDEDLPILKKHHYEDPTIPLPTIKIQITKTCMIKSMIDE